MPRKRILDVQDAAGDAVERGGLDEALNAERASWIHERQAELERVADHHDELVRELFHMERFGLMLAYDPTEAKRDDSSVFQTFASHFNLLRDAPAGVVPRRTRKSQADFFSSLSTSPQKASVTGLHPVRVDPSPNSASAAGPSESKQPKKRRRTDDAGSTTRFSVEEYESVTTVLQHGSQTPKSISRRKAAITALAPPSVVLNDSKLPEPAPFGRQEEVSISTRKRLKPSASSEKATATPSRPQRPARPPPRYRDGGKSTAQVEHQALSAPPGPRVKRGNIRSTPPPSSLSHLPSSPPNFSSIKRVKLVVRPPPPLISHPEHRTITTSPAHRLETFLNSYITLEEEDETPGSLESMTLKDAVLKEKGREMKAQGRLRPLSHADNGALDGHLTYATTSRDTWATVVVSVIERPQANLGAITAEQASHHIASLIRGHWKESEKEMAAEDRRLQRLAKSIVNLVVDEWRKAVFHVRKQQRLREEEEEHRRGQEHLDAILDRSGQILEAQQAALVRTGSSRSITRSNSVRSSLDPTSSNDGSDSEFVNDDDAPAFDQAGSDIDEDSDNNPALSSLFELSSAGLTNVLRQRRRRRQSRGTYSARSSSPDPHSAVPSPRSSSRSLPSSSLNRDGRRESGHGLSDLYPVDLPTAMPALSSSSSTTSHPSPPHPPDYLDAPMLADKASNSSAICFASSQDGMNGHQNFPHTNRDKSPVSFVESLPSSAVPVHDGASEDEQEGEAPSFESEPLPQIPEHLKAYAAASVRWNEQAKVSPPFLLRGTLRPYQRSGLEWLVSLHNGNTNGILADEMGLGKTIQTISLLGHLACDRGIWGPHLIIVPTSVILNWEMEFKKFLPGFRVLGYHGNAMRRKELRKGWTTKDCFNVCITSYTLAAKDHHIFKRKAWYYMILDEAHMIKNFKSQRWNILLGFNSFRRLLLTGTPLQNNLTELWALLQFLMSGTNFADRKEFGDWFSNPLEKAIEIGDAFTDENQHRVSKLHSLLRPHLLRRLKQDVEKELPKKYEHLVLCPLSKRQRFLYDEFMSRRQTTDDLGSGMYYRIANILMQLRKVCNHPDLFEVRPIVTSFAMSRSAVADFEIRELLIRRRFLMDPGITRLPELPGIRFIDAVNISFLTQARSIQAEDITSICIPLDPRPPKDLRTISGFKQYKAQQVRSRTLVRWMDMDRLNRMRCSTTLPLCCEAIAAVGSMVAPLVPLSALDQRSNYLSTSIVAHSLVLSHSDRALQMREVLNRFAFATHPVVALDLPRLALAGYDRIIRLENELHPRLFEFLHHSSVKLQIAFPDSSLLQYDCGKLQELRRLLRERKAGGHRVLIFTQMTKVLDILETFLNLHGYLYLRLDGATKIEDRQYITERFNSDSRIFCFISSSRSGGVGINLTGADTVIFYDSDFNPQMDRQCEDRAHRIGQIRDVHIYRFVSKHTVEEALLRKANQKRSLDDLVIQRGEFDWRTLFRDQDTAALNEALGAVEDTEDAEAARAAAREAVEVEGADDADFNERELGSIVPVGFETPSQVALADDEEHITVADNTEEDEEGGTIAEYMLRFILRDDEKIFDDWSV